MLLDASALVKRYELAVAPDIELHVELSGERCHWYVKVPVDVQVPFVVDKVEPVVQEPETTGAEELIAVSTGTTTVATEGDVYLYVVPETIRVPKT
jgi:hypothetical protein